MILAAPLCKDLHTESMSCLAEESLIWPTHAQQIATVAALEFKPEALNLL